MGFASLYPSYKHARCPTGKSLRLIRIYVKPPAKKYPSSIFPKIMIVSAHPASAGGAYRDRHGRRKRDAVDAVRATTKRASAYGEIVRSRSPDAGIKLADDEFAGDGG
jgi:hypothetical protein